MKLTNQIIKKSLIGKSYFIKGASMENVIKIAIVWESATGGGVNSYLRYLLQSKAFLNKGGYP